MPDLTASAESAASALTGPELFAGVQSGADVKITVTQVMAAVLSLLGDTDSTLAGNSDLRVATQKAIKSYVDSKLAGLSWKQEVRAATTVNGTLATAYVNGQTIDGVTLATGDRILVKNQTTASENGIYLAAASGAPARTTDANTGAELVNATMYVSEGTTLADSQWTCSTNAPITVGTTSLAFVQAGSGGVTSVAGRTGVVVLSMGDIADSYDIRTFGTLHNDGTTDDAATLAAAIATGARLIVARGLNIALLTQISLRSGQTIDLAGTTITTASSTITTFLANTIDDWQLLGPFTIVGSGSTVGTAKGINVSGCNRWLVKDYTAKNIEGWSLYLLPGSPSGTARGDRGRVSGMMSYGCYYGWEDTASSSGGSEYTIVTDYSAALCTVFGLKTCAGNTTWKGGNVVDNVGDGVQMVGGANHGHGVMTAMNVNHNGAYNLNLSGVVNGYTFSGCHFYEKTILLDGCNGIVFTGGRIDTPTITVNSGAGSGQCRMMGVWFPNGYGNPAAIGGTAPDSLVLKDCGGPGNPGNNDIVLVPISADYTYVMGDEGVLHLGSDTTARTVNIPANASVPYRKGKVLSGVNQHAAGVVTLAILGGDTMRWGGNSGVTGSRTVAADGTWAAEKIAATEWLVTGVGMT